MLYIPKINDYLEILTDVKIKDFAANHFNEAITKEKIFRKVVKLLYIFLITQSNSSDNCAHHYNVEILNLFDPELQLINTNPVIKNKF